MGSADELWPLLMQFGFEHVLRHFLRAVSEFDLSPPQAHLLLHLGQGRALSQREHARLLGCDPSNLTGLSDRLEARGLIERRVDPEDRRVKTLVATPKGEELRARLAARLSVPPEAMAHLSAQDRATLHQVLSKLVDLPASTA
ncbi:MAG TPA: MarR family transcriptional regulator [Chloroflexota bacterium]|jgi:DNA-binding MarR family transcriptional regulator|nr:MarR family transcriptional regulator [Chloroflexota bacterium]